jgi:hypothetical protein
MKKIKTVSGVLTPSTNPSDSSPQIDLYPHTNPWDLIAVKSEPTDMYIYMDNAEAPSEMADNLAFSRWNSGIDIPEKTENSAIDFLVKAENSGIGFPVKTENCGIDFPVKTENCGIDFPVKTENCGIGVIVKTENSCD